MPLTLPSRSRSLLSPATVYPAGVKIRVAPEGDRVPWPSHLPLPNRVGVCEMVEGADGRYSATLRLHSTMIRMKANITEELGLGITYASLRRLMTAGFVKSEQVTPGQYSFCLASYFRHLSAVHADPEFWAIKGKNYRRYMEAI